MDVSITTFINPFSFFCKVNGTHEQFKAAESGERCRKSKIGVYDLSHGQYVKVWWKNQWTRGIVSTDNCILIWLIDYGIYYRPDEKTKLMDLPTNYKTLPTDVFEASIHGVSPVDKVVSDDCEIKNEVTTTWNQGTTETVLNLLKTASKITFVPIAMLTTNTNDIVLGDLYLKIGPCHINLINKLETWPVYLERNEEHYTKNLPTYYAKSHRKHEACMLKPQFPNFELPSVTLATSFDEYNAICTKVAELPNPEVDECSSQSSDVTSSTAATYSGKFNFELTANMAKMEEYSSVWVTLGGKEYNMLELIKKKMEDLKMCEKYKHMGKGLGRATSRRRFHDEE